MTSSTYMRIRYLNSQELKGEGGGAEGQRAETLRGSLSQPLSKPFRCPTCFVLGFYRANTGETWSKRDFPKENPLNKGVF